MYNYEWARRIVVNFRNDRTRTNNLDQCLIEEASFLYRPKEGYTSIGITLALIKALQNKPLNIYWNAYKKLVKTSPLSMDLLKTVAQYLAWEYDYRRWAAEQMEFHF